MPTFEDWLKIFGPTWLQDAGGKAMLGTMGAQVDGGIDQAMQAVQARFLSRAPADALAKIGGERRIPQAPWETTDDYRASLVRAWEAWGGDPVLGGGAGTPAGVLTAVSRCGVPFRYATDLAGSPDATTYVQWNGRWVQLYADTRTPIFGTLDPCQTRPYVAQTSFLPSGLGSTLKLWLRGSDGITVAGGNVTAIADQSGNGNNVVANGTVGYTAASINGQPGWSFTGVSGSGMLQNLTTSPISSGSARTIFVVVRAKSNAGGPLFQNTRLGIVSLYLQPGPSIVYGGGPGTVYTDQVLTAPIASLPPVPIAGAPMILEFSCAAATAFLKMKINGVVQSLTQASGCDAEASGSAGFLVGGWEASSRYAGDICEVIACDTVLSSIAADNVRTYLSQYYNIPVVAGPNAFASGWFDGGSLASRSYLLFPTPGGVVTGLDNTLGNQLKSSLNATVKLWKRASESYGGAWVFNSQGPDFYDAPEGSDEWWLNKGSGGGGCLGWPPASMDPNQILGDGYVLTADSSTFIDPA